MARGQDEGESHALERFDVVVVGCGAAGLSAAVSAAEAGRFRLGPVWPNPVTRTITSRGLIADSTSQPRPYVSSVPVR